MTIRLKPEPCREAEDTYNDATEHVWDTFLETAAQDGHMSVHPWMLSKPDSLPMLSMSSASESPVELVKMQDLRPQPKPSESES